MKVTDFLDEWNKTHTSSPSFQDTLDWAEQKINHDVIEKACNILCQCACPYKIDSNKCWNTECDIRETFRRMMED